MTQLTEQDKQKIIEALQERGANEPCPRCRNTDFTVVDGYFYQALQTELNAISLGGPGVPSVAVVCTKCGFMSQHALGALGLLPEGGRS